MRVCVFALVYECNDDECEFCHAYTPFSSNSSSDSRRSASSRMSSAIPASYESSLLLLLLLLMLLMLLLAVLLFRMVLLLLLAPPPALLPLLPWTPPTRALASVEGFKPDRSRRLFHSGGIAIDDDDDDDPVNTPDTGDKPVIVCWTFKSFSSLKPGIFKSPLPPFPISSFKRMASIRWLGNLCVCKACC